MTPHFESPFCACPPCENKRRMASPDGGRGFLARCLAAPSSLSRDLCPICQARFTDSGWCDPCIESARDYHTEAGLMPEPR